jgi:hypothetical protein
MQRNARFGGSLLRDEILMQVWLSFHAIHITHYWSFSLPNEAIFSIFNRGRLDEAILKAMVAITPPQLTLLIFPDFFCPSGSWNLDLCKIRVGNARMFWEAASVEKNIISKLNIWRPHNHSLLYLYNLEYNSQSHMLFISCKTNIEFGDIL